MQGILKTICMRVSVVAFGLAAVAAQAQDDATVHTRVLPAEQAARDTERVRILHEELAKEQGRAVEAAKRRAERLAAGDAQGVQEAEASQQRATASIAALQREIGLATRSAGSTPPAAKVAAGYRPAPRPPAQAPAVAPAPWWDVYGKSPRQAGAAAQRVSVADDPAGTGERAQ